MRLSQVSARKGSRLDSFIRRLEAQRACLDWAVGAIASVPGAVVELGLGNGRTYDHLRARCDGAREIFAFDRQVAAHPACIPDAAHLVLGDFRDTLPAFASRHAGRSSSTLSLSTSIALASSRCACHVGPK